MAFGSANHPGYAFSGHPKKLLLEVVVNECRVVDRVEPSVVVGRSGRVRSRLGLAGDRTSHPGVSGRSSQKQRALLITIMRKTFNGRPACLSSHAGEEMLPLPDSPAQSSGTQSLPLLGCSALGQIGARSTKRGRRRPVHTRRMVNRCEHTGCDA